MYRNKVMFLTLIFMVICGISQVAFPYGCDCVASSGGCRTYPNCPPDYTGEVYFCKDDASAEVCSGAPAWFDPNCEVDPSHTCSSVWKQGCADGVLQGRDWDTGLDCGGSVSQCSW